MDRYKAGALSQAIEYWEPIYRELGAQKGYRLAYDLGVAYAEFGDAAHAAERLQSFLGELETRRAHGELLGALVAKEEADARSRIAGLVATKGRIQIDSGERARAPQAVQVDANEPRLAGFVAWVNPGEHAVTFAPGTPEAQTKTVEVKAGEMIELSPTPLPAPVPPNVTTSNVAPTTTASVSPPPAPQVPGHTARETQHPFSPALLYVGGGVAIALGIAAIPLESHAFTLRDRYVPNALGAEADAQTFYSARTLAYTAVGGAVGLGAVTAGLAAWYFVGTSRREKYVTPTAAAALGGATFGVDARF
jgi:hypothetical protein